MNKDKNMRIEKDSMGTMKVPVDALYGPQTQRAVENFPISNICFTTDFISAIVIIKRSASIVNEKLGAKISFEPGFESNFSGMFGMNRLDNNWILTGELNLQMENYFKSAERGEFFWRRIDSLSQTIKIGTIFPHPFGWRTGVDLDYQHEIFRGLYASIENRYLFSTYFPLIGTTGFGYVTGKTTPTLIGREKGYEKTSYSAFSLFSKKENINDRYLPTSGNALIINADGGLDGKTVFLNSGIKFLKIGPINRNIFFKISYNANGILYKGANVPKSRYHRFGGSSTLRGYDEQYFRATQFQIPSFELGYYLSLIHISEPTRPY